MQPVPYQPFEVLEPRAIDDDLKQFGIVDDGYGPDFFGRALSHFRSAIALGPSKLGASLHSPELLVAISAMADP
jgi:hypothetical protein